MDADELRRLLNIKAKPLPTGESLQDAQVNPTKKGVKGTTRSEYALQLDAFDQSKGVQIIRHNPTIRKLDLSCEEVADFYALHFLTSPSPVEACTDERRLEFVQEILQSPDHLALHRRTELNPLASELATEELSKSYAKLKEEDKGREEEQKLGNLSSRQAKIEKELAMMNAVASSLQKSEEAVEKMEESMAALGCGPGQGGNERMDSAKLAKLFSRLKDNGKLQKIFDKAGKARRFHQAQKRQKVLHGYDDMIGVTLSGEVGRLLPQELLMLVDPDLELDATRRLLESQSLSKQFQGVEKVGKGPIVMCVDESGSMSGDPEEWAKAIALTLAWRAKQEKRFCVLIGYSGGTEGTKLVLPPTKWNESELLDWLVHFFGGGTALDLPLAELPNKWWPEFIQAGMQQGKTDLFLVTDGIVDIPDKLASDFLQWKQQNQCHSYGLIVGHSGFRQLEEVLDEVLYCAELNLGEEAVQRILSL